ncbi:MAG: helix-turn-helix domain-containing protein, partial [Phycisphaerae bacterium]
LSMLCVPGAWFLPGDDHNMRDINSLQLQDYGTTIRLGSRHWSAHAISSAFDADFRRTLRRQELMQSGSLGGGIRRIRKERRLAREEFPGIDAKTIARIERNEITRPQRETLRLIAQTLGLPIERLLGAMAVPPTDSPEQQQTDEHSASA